MNKSLRVFSKGLFGGVSTEDKINFARHLSIVIKAGLPLLEGLKIIRRQTPRGKLLTVIDQILIDISNGQFLATSLAKFPEVFDDFFVNIVRVGETSGTLAANLYHVADEMKKSADLKSKVRSAMIYPVIIMFATLGLVSFLVFFAFPKILPLFASLKVELPLPTKILIAVSSFMIANGIWLVVGLVLFFLAMKILLLMPTVRYFTAKIYFILPVFSKLTIDINMANFSRVLAILLKGGIKIVEATTITAQTFENLVYQRALLQAAQEVKKGEPLARNLALYKHIFPPLLVGLVEIGESTGNLIENLEYIADYYREESENSLRNLTAILEPMLLLTMGLVVGFVAISIITPIYKITQGVGG